MQIEDNLIFQKNKNDYQKDILKTKQIIKFTELKKQICKKRNFLNLVEHQLYLKHIAKNYKNRLLSKKYF